MSLTGPADSLDVAAETTEKAKEFVLSHRVVYSGVSSLECEDCGEEIPEGRRNLLPGCKLCPACAQEEEARPHANRILRY